MMSLKMPYTSRFNQCFDTGYTSKEAIHTRKRSYSTALDSHERVMWVLFGTVYSDVG